VSSSEETLTVATADGAVAVVTVVSAVKEAVVVVFDLFASHCIQLRAEWLLIELDTLLLAGGDLNSAVRPSTRPKRRDGISMSSLP
jgi:hypothetical protein